MSQKTGHKDASLLLEKLGKGEVNDEILPSKK
jgi:hypothetical protein